MLNLISQGGPVFMGVLTLLLLAILILSFIRGKSVLDNTSDRSSESLHQGLTIIKSIGTLALVIGVLGQLIGLYNGFQAMEVANGNISPAILAGGLKVSMISTIYGVIIFLLARVIHLFLSSRLN